MHTLMARSDCIKEVRTEGEGYGSMPRKVEKGEGSIFTVFLRMSFIDDPYLVIT